VTLGTSFHPYLLAIDASNVYWSDNLAGQVWKAPLAGGNATLLASGVPNPNGIAVDATDVYFTTDAGLRKVPIAGGPLVVIDNQCCAKGVALDANNVYWCNDAAGTIYQTPKAGGAILTLTNVESAPVNLAVDATTVYWANYNGQVRSVPIGGGFVATVAAIVNIPWGITVDANNVYWTAEGENNVWQAKKGGFPPVLAASGQVSPTGIAVDATRIYWTNINGGSVAMAPIGGAMNVTYLDTNGVNPLGIAVDAKAVYWADHAGWVKKLAKPP